MANQIVIAGGQVGSTNWINTEVADNEYPVMGSGIYAALQDLPSGGGFSPFVITFTDDGGPVADKTWAEVVAAYEEGQRLFLGIFTQNGGVPSFASYQENDGALESLSWNNTSVTSVFGTTGTLTMLNVYYSEDTLDVTPDMYYITVASPF